MTAGQCQSQLFLRRYLVQTQRTANLNVTVSLDIKGSFWIHEFTDRRPSLSITAAIKTFLRICFFFLLLAFANGLTRKKKEDAPRFFFSSSVCMNEKHQKNPNQTGTGAMVQNNCSSYDTFCLQLWKLASASNPGREAELMGAAVRLLC